MLFMCVASMCVASKQLLCKRNRGDTVFLFASYDSLELSEVHSSFSFDPSDRSTLSSASGVSDGVIHNLG